MVVAYKTSIGPYKKAADLYTESWSLLPTREQIGLYYDDPQVFQYIVTHTYIYITVGNGYSEVLKLSGNLGTLD